MRQYNRVRFVQLLLQIGNIASLFPMTLSFAIFDLLMNLQSVNKRWALGEMPRIQKVAKDVFCQTKTALQLTKDKCKDDPKRLYFERRSERGTGHVQKFQELGGIFVQIETLDSITELRRNYLFPSWIRSPIFFFLFSLSVSYTDAKRVWERLDTGWNSRQKWTAVIPWSVIKT